MSKVTEGVRGVGYTRGAILRQKQLTANCCVDHTVPFPASKPLCVTSWKFPARSNVYEMLPHIHDHDENLQVTCTSLSEKSEEKRKFGKYSHLTLLHQKRLHELRDMEVYLKQCKEKDFLQKVQESVDANVMENLSQLLDVKMPSASEENVVSSESADVHKEEELETSEKLDEATASSQSKISTSSNESLDLGTENPYRNLLKRLDREEYERKHPDKEREQTKMLGEHLQHVIKDFASWTATFGMKKDENAVEDEEEEEEKRQPIIEAKVIRELFKFEFGKPRLHPALPALVKEPAFDPRITKRDRERYEMYKVKQQQKMIMEPKEEKYHIVWYLHPKKWFKKSKKDAEKHKEVLTEKELKDQQLITHHGIKCFMEYLKRQKLELPQFLSDAVQKSAR